MNELDFSIEDLYKLYLALSPEARKRFNDKLLKASNDKTKDEMY